MRHGRRLRREELHDPLSVLGVCIGPGFRLGGDLGKERAIGKRSLVCPKIGRARAESSEGWWAAS